MERYIFIRAFGAIPAKSMLITEGKGFRAYKPTGKKVVPKIKEISHDLGIHLLPLSVDLFRLAYESLPYRSWLNEKASEIDEQGLRVYEDGMDRSKDTLIMYLMDIGVSSDTLTRLIHKATGGHGLGVIAF